ncbi:hypothetical protein DFH28DRAFT_1089635 [Melampsora americana]|nr:hypothetical protein DFH28DRAFT_1089635 [Melampsora americana]
MTVEPQCGPQARSRTAQQTICNPSNHPTTQIHTSQIKSALQDLVQKETNSDKDASRALEWKDEKMRLTRAAEKLTPRGRPLSNSEFNGKHKSTGKGKIPSHHHVQLTTFVRGYVPVSMFPRAWWNKNLETKNQKPIKKKSTRDEDEHSDQEKFKGNSYPMELWLTYGDWVLCFMLMVDYIRNWCKHKELALSFKQHMKNVQQIKRENDDNRMIALHYNISIRRQVWTT